MKYFSILQHIYAMFYSMFPFWGSTGGSAKGKENVLFHVSPLGESTEG